MADDQADDRWTVRGVPKYLRDQVSAAAQRAGVSVGSWVCQAFDRALVAEREPMDIEPPWHAADNLSATDRLGVIERVVNAAVTLSEAPEIPVGLRRKANRLLRDELPEPKEGRMSGSQRVLTAPNGVRVTLEQPEA